MIIKSNANIASIYLCIFTLLLFCACGQVTDTPSGQGDTGIYRPHLVFPESVSEITVKALNEFSCGENGVDTIEFNFILNGQQYGPHTYPCEDHHASISGVPAGKGVTVEVFADDGAGNALYEGTEVVDIIRDQVTPGGEIQMLAAVEQTPGGGFYIRELDMEFVYIRKGSFNMGSLEEEEDPAGNDDERPRHQVTFAQSYYMQTTEVTQDQYRKIMGANPSGFPSCGGTCPVETVSWEDAWAFIRALNARVAGGYEFRLPTEAEWEYAARAGTTTAYSFGDTLTTAQANFYDPDSDYNGPMPVGSFTPNAWGLYDMHGNVREWVEDDWHGNYQSAPLDGIAWIDEPTRGDDRVLRGGSWRFNVYYYDAEHCRSAYRSSFTPGGRSNGDGFRLASP